MTPEEREMLLEMPAVQELIQETVEACARVAEADKYGEPDGLVPADERWDGGSSERAADRIAAAIRAMPFPLEVDRRQDGGQRADNAKFFPAGGGVKP